MRITSKITYGCPALKKRKVNKSKINKPSAAAGRRKFRGGGVKESLDERKPGQNLATSFKTLKQRWTLTPL